MRINRGADPLFHFARALVSKSLLLEARQRCRDISVADEHRGVRSRLVSQWLDDLSWSWAEPSNETEACSFLEALAKSRVHETLANNAGNQGTCYDFSALLL